MQENIIAAIPQGSADTVLEVALIHDDSQDVHIELRYQAWGSGVGWYRQHTLKLDRSAAQALFRTLGYIRSCLAKLPLDGSAEKVIPLSSVDRTQVTTQQQLSNADACMPVSGRCELLSENSMPQTSSQERVHMGRKSTCCRRYARKGKACKDCPTMRKLSTRQHCTLAACDTLEELLPSRLSREITRIHSPSSYAPVFDQGTREKM